MGARGDEWRGGVGGDGLLLCRLGEETRRGGGGNRLGRWATCNVRQRERMSRLAMPGRPLGSFDGHLGSSSCSHFPRRLRSTVLGCGRVGGTRITTAIIYRSLRPPPRPPLSRPRRLRLRSPRLAVLRAPRRAVARAATGPHSTRLGIFVFLSILHMEYMRATAVRSQNIAHTHRVYRRTESAACVVARGPGTTPGATRDL